jgi:hypothetical protein
VTPDEGHVLRWLSHNGQHVYYMDSQRATTTTENATAKSVNARTFSGGPAWMREVTISSPPPVRQPPYVVRVQTRLSLEGPCANHTYS